MERLVSVVLQPDHVDEAPLVRLPNGLLVEIVEMHYEGRHPVFTLWSAKWQATKKASEK